MPSAVLLVLTVAAVGVFHTMVPDHWLPIAVLARSRGWTSARTGRGAALAGLGHVASTLALGFAAWAVGAIAAARYGNLLNAAAGFALVAFGAWIAVGAVRELRAEGHQTRRGHAHLHRHADGTEHVHWHEHGPADWHPGTDRGPIHTHAHDATGRSRLLFLLGSSPMVEGLPAFFAAAPLGAATLGAMAGVFAIATILTYVVLSVVAVRGLERRGLGRFERYGELLSGLVVAAVGLLTLVL